MLHIFTPNFLAISATIESTIKTIKDTASPASFFITGYFPLVAW